MLVASIQYWDSGNREIVVLKFINTMRLVEWAVHSVFLYPQATCSADSEMLGTLKALNPKFTV